MYVYTYTRMLYPAPVGQIVAVASPKGGVGKSTEVLCLPGILAAHKPGLRQLIVDADENRSIYDCVQRTPDDALPGIDLDALDDPQQLGKLRRLRDRYDIIWIDLPGAKATGELESILRGENGEPVPDLIVVPMKASTFDLRVVIRAVEQEIQVVGATYGVVMTMVNPQALEAARNVRDQLDARGIDTFKTFVRGYTDYEHAEAANLPINRYGGRRSYARKAEDDQRALAREVVKALGLQRRITIPTREQEAGHA